MQQKQANQDEVEEGCTFLDKYTHEALRLMRWLDKSGDPISRHPDLSVKKAADISILYVKEPMPSDMLLRLNSN